VIALVAACSVATHNRRTHAAAQDQGYVAVIRPSFGGVLGGPDRRVERAEAGGDPGAAQAAHSLVANGFGVGLERQQS
jgi:hypothetical protein